MWENRRKSLLRMGVETEEEDEFKNGSRRIGKSEEEKE